MKVVKQGSITQAGVQLPERINFTIAPRVPARLEDEPSQGLCRQRRQCRATCD